MSRAARARCPLRVKARVLGAGSGAAEVAGVGLLSPFPLSSVSEERGTDFLGAGYPGWRSCLANPGLPSETPSEFCRWRALRARRFGCGGVALAAESARRPSGELCWPAECEPHRPNEHLHSEPPTRHGAAVVRARSARRRNLAARSALTLTLPAKMGEGGRVGALSGAERAPLPPPG